MNIMILAAGEGTRLRPFTEQSPKPAIPFLTVPLAFYTLSLLDQTKIDRLVVNTYHLPRQIENLFTQIPPQWKDLYYSSEQGQLLGSGGGIHNVQKQLTGKGDFFVFNGDEIILPHQYGVLDEMQVFQKWHKGIATLLTIQHPEVGGKFGGAWLNKEGTKIQCFSKKSPGEQAPRGLHFTGVLLLSERVFTYFKDQIVDENILYDTLTKAMAAGEEVHAFETKAEWFETGNPGDFMAATESCLNSLIKNSGNHPYWQDYLMQTIRLYSKNQYLIEKDWARFPDLQTAIQKIKKGTL
jgi:mannose-1-phosphate guanylyltransferase